MVPQLRRAAAGTAGAAGATVDGGHGGDEAVAWRRGMREEYLNGGNLPTSII